MCMVVINIFKSSQKSMKFFFKSLTYLWLVMFKASIVGVGE